MGRLFEEVCSFDNLHAAAWEVLRGKRGRPGANRLFLRLEDTVLELERALRSGAYVPGPYRSFWIRDPKPRLISAACLGDRVVHHAVVRVIEPVFERRFIFHSYACRRGKGNHRALAQFAEWARTRRYVLMLDIHRFFPSIDHQVLKAEIRRGLKDAPLLALLDVIIDGSNPQEPVAPRWFEGDALFAPLERRRGIPIGNLTSQFLANVLLDRVDHFVKERLRMKRYLRYVDDLAIFHDDPAVLRDARGAIAEALGALRLTLSPGKSRLRRPKEGLGFLGFTVRPGSVRLGGGAVRRARRRGHELERRYARRQASLEDVRRSWVAWVAHVRHGDTEGLLRAVARARVYRRGEARE